MINVSGVSKKIKRHHILQDVDLNMEGIYGLIGPNGAGKTTLMKIIAGLISMNHGTIEINGEDYTKGKYVKPNNLVGYLPQDFMIYPKVTVQEALDHIALLQGIMEKDKRRSRIHQALNQVNLLGQENKKMMELSGGMKKRVGIAQLLLGNPVFLLFDEPTAGLDIEERIRFRHLLRQLGIKRTVVISSHIVEDIEFLSTKLAVLKEGRVQIEGTPENLKQKAEGYVWEGYVPLSDLGDVMAREDVVSITEEATHGHVRLFSENAPDGYKQAKPRLVDGYLAVVKGVS